MSDSFEYTPEQMEEWIKQGWTKEFIQFIERDPNGFEPPYYPFLFNEKPIRDKEEELRRTSPVLKLVHSLPLINLEFIIPWRLTYCNQARFTNMALRVKKWIVVLPDRIKPYFKLGTCGFQEKVRLRCAISGKIDFQHEYIHTTGKTRLITENYNNTLTVQGVFEVVKIYFCGYLIWTTHPSFFDNGHFEQNLYKYKDLI